MLSILEVNITQGSGRKNESIDVLHVSTSGLFVLYPRRSRVVGGSHLSGESMFRSYFYDLFS